VASVISGFDVESLIASQNSVSLCLCGERSSSESPQPVRGAAISVISVASVISGFDFDFS
jgi:hypothetical protein